MPRLTLTLCLFSAIGASSAWAGLDHDSGRSRRLADTAPQAAPRELPSSQQGLNESAMSPSEAARQVQRRYGGRVLAVQPAGDGYRVKVLKDGEVRIYQVNP
ncbi:MAG: hypothetical protein WC809_01105 [Sinimarinibacterium sp.]|jgi:hypothetical protein